MSPTADSLQTARATIVNAVPFTISGEDERHYRIITLSNRLRCILVSDPDTDKEAAALEVAVGHFSDPDELPGLAHFLEHMLFLGTEKYPDENSFSSFLSQHCGYSNAYTSSEHTLYHFELNKGHIREALDRFAQFFAAPLFTESATDRELKAVDNEHKKNCQNDVWRSFQLLKTTANAISTPFTKFGTGSYETLYEKPRESGNDARKALLKFHSDYYSANMMCLCVIGTESLDILQQHVESCFSAIEDRDLTEPFFGGPIFDESCLMKMFRIVPVKDSHSLRIVWEMPSTESLYRTNPAGFIAHLLGHESEGSILSALKARGVANALSAGESFMATGFTLFTVTITLSPEGLSSVDDIIGIVFQYIRLLSAADSNELTRLYVEKQKIADLNFEFKGKERPGSYCNELARNLHKTQIEDVLSAHYLYRDFDEPMIRRFISYLVPERARFEVQSQKFANECNLREKWYGTAYSVESVSTSAEHQFTNDVLSPGSLHLPLPNTFIASDFSLKSQIRHTVNNDEAPVLLRDDADIRLWFRNDSIFGKPKLNITAEFCSAEAYCTPRASVLCQLFTRLLSESLNEFAYNAEIAGLAYSIDPKPAGIELYIRGYNEKLHVLLLNIIEHMAVPRFDQARFELVRESIQRTLANFSLEQPYQHSLYHQALATESPKWSVEMRLQQIQDATLTDVLQFAKQMLGHGRWHVLVHGNADEKEARSLADMFTAHLPAQSSQILRPDLRVVKLSSSTEAMFTQAVQNPDELNSSALLYYQIGQDDCKLRARLRLVAHIAQEPCFHRLRTVEQLGYLVFSSMLEQRGILGFRILVQSSEFSPLHLRSRILNFIEELREIIKSMDQTEYEKILAAVVDTRTQKDKTLTEETKRIWSQISRHRYEFDARLKEATELRTISKNDLLSFFDKFLDHKGDNMRRFSSLVFGSKHAMTVPENVQHIDDLDTFKRSLELYRSCS